MGRQDYESETLIAHALSAEGFDASEDGTGRGVPMIPIAICTAHTQSNGSGFSDGIAHALERGTTQAVAFSAKDYGADASELAPTLRGRGHETSHANGGGQVAIAFAQNQSGDVLSGEVMQSLGTNANATGRNAANVAVAWTGELNASTDIVGTMQRGGEGDGYFESIDDGESWRRDIDGLAHRYCWSIAVSKENASTVLLSASRNAYAAHYEQTASSYVYRRTETEAWRQVRDGLPESRGLRIPVLASSRIEPGVFYMSAEGMVYRSSDDGSRWQELAIQWEGKRKAEHAINMTTVEGSSYNKPGGKE